MINSEFIESAKKQFLLYKKLGEQAIEQTPDEKLFWQYNNDSNSIGTIVKHLWGNMLSRWTDFLTSDGEKESRDRDAEFENDTQTRAELLNKWNQGWACLFEALNTLQPTDLGKIIYIRNQGHSVLEAINRQMTHYSYHVGQIIFIAKMCANKEWKSLSIPKNKSKEYNQEKFAKDKSRQHFTDEFIKKK